MVDLERVDDIFLVSAHSDVGQRVEVDAVTWLIVLEQCLSLDLRGTRLVTVALLQERRGLQLHRELQLELLKQSVDVVERESPIF